MGLRVGPAHPGGRALSFRAWCDFSGSQCCGPEEKRNTASHHFLPAEEEMEEMPPPFSPQLLAAQCPASFRTLNVTSSEVCLASLSKQPTPPLFPYPLCRALMKTGNPHRCVHICIK